MKIKFANTILVCILHIQNQLIMIVPQSKINLFINQWRGASIKELKERLLALNSKSKTASVVAEIKAIKTLML